MILVINVNNEEPLFMPNSFRSLTEVFNNENAF